MSSAPFTPGPVGSWIVQGNRVVGHMMLGGDMLLMPLGDKTVLFELHHYFGPIPTSKRTLEPLERIPRGFWDAFERWVKAGRLVDGELCVLEGGK